MALSPSQPTLGNTLAELNVPLHMFRILKGLPDLFGLPKGDGRPVYLLPGFGAGEATLTPLRLFLNRLDYDAKTWGMGTNEGHVDTYVDLLIEKLEARPQAELADQATLIGWSLGGVIAREVARLRPDLVRAVITMGTPVVGGPKYTRAAGLFARNFNIDLDEFEEEVHARNSQGLDVPVVCIYSKSDGVVSWQASVDTYNRQAKNLRVSSAHTTLGFSPEVYAVIAKNLAST